MFITWALHLHDTQNKKKVPAHYCLFFTRDNSASRICRYFFVTPFVAYIKKNKKRNQKQEKRNETKCPNFTFSGNL